MAMDSLRHSSRLGGVSGGGCQTLFETRYRHTLTELTPPRRVSVKTIKFQINLDLCYCCEKGAYNKLSAQTRLLLLEVYDSLAVYRL